MATHGSVAKKVREHKEAHPELYCSKPNCLWRLSSGPCPKLGHSLEGTALRLQANYFRAGGTVA